MSEWQLKSKTNSMVIYEQKQSEECYNTAYFDLLSKTLHVTVAEFVRHDDNKVIPMERLDYSAKYGHWQTSYTYLGLEDIRTLSQLAELYLVKESEADD